MCFLKALCMTPVPIWERMGYSPIQERMGHAQSRRGWCTPLSRRRSRIQSRTGMDGAIPPPPPLQGQEGVTPLPSRTGYPWLVSRGRTLFAGFFFWGLFTRSIILPFRVFFLSLPFPTSSK